MTSGVRGTPLHRTRLISGQRDTPGRGIPLHEAELISGWGVPWDTPILAQDLIWIGNPPRRDMLSVKVLWDRDGVTPLEKGHGTSGWKDYEIEIWYSHRGVNRLKKLPFLILWMWAVDTSLGTIGRMYSVDIPKCWHGRIVADKMITLIRDVEISIKDVYLLCLVGVVTFSLWYIKIIRIQINNCFK